MRAVIQRVTSSKVTVDGKIIGEIGVGLNVLLCAMQRDTEEDAQILAKKIAQLRIFSDEQGKMNLSITQVGGSILLISQFTLAADTRKGNRPSFTPAAEPQTAKALYKRFADLLHENSINQVEMGVFGADMKVDIANDGPVTIMLDSKEWLKGE